MARTRNQVIAQALPDAPPAGAVVTLRVEEGGSWTAVVEIPLTSGGTLTQLVRPSDVNATKATRAATCAEDLYDKAAQLAGFVQS
jgi:hypothetical protein